MENSKQGLFPYVKDYNKIHINLFRAYLETCISFPLRPYRTYPRVENFIREACQKKVKTALQIQNVVELPIPVPSLSCPYPIPVLSLSRPYPVPIPSLSRPYPVPIPSLSRPYLVPAGSLF